MTSKKRGLGRGLEALLVDVPAKDDREDVADTVTRMQEVERLKAQLPTTARMQEVEQRREQLPRAKQASIAAEKQQMPVTIEEMDGQVVMAAALIKNIQRESSHLLEEAESLISLLDEFELMVRRLEID
jgi:ParB family chromosome partitioning protein